MNMPLLDVFGIGEAFWDLLYNIFVRGPLYIVHGLGDAITYLSGQKVVDKIFGSHGHFLNMPPQFLIFLVISVILIVLFGGGVILHAMVNQGIGSAIAGLANRVIMVILLMVLVPLFFWVINFTVISIIHIIMPQFVNGETLANMVGSLGFTDGQNHQNWHYDSGYPDWNNYNLFLGTFGSLFCLVIFFYLGLSLIQRLFDLFLLYITSPVIFATAVSGAKWQKVNLWKDLVIGRFISTLGIVLSLTLFLNLEPLMMNVATEVSDSWMGQTAFKLLFIAGGAIATLNAQMLFSAMVGQTVGVMEGMRMLSTMKAASSGVKAGTLGMLGVGKGLVWGKKKTFGNASIGASVAGGLASGVIGKTVGFATKATIGSVLATAGFIAGTKHSIQKHGWKDGTKQGAKVLGKQTVKPAVALGKIVKEKTTKSYNAGLNKHSASKYAKPSKALKKQLKKSDGKDKNNHG
ncbi:Mbov_0396 family ICE element transmembrane protein [Spiroplasma sp. AdecLV25b]|uniref:Mbov_0396 family ICE element transmembrane protein n=1 Tax=Spiroplasma sp. AdecLV25b TaxID=3027162 RepID=UPI0027E08145|nr:hypothetical protein [Spiroplasma sp. AdecLV25b]